MENKTIRVEIAYALPENQCLLMVDVAPGSSIETALRASGILALFPHIDLTKQKVGVFGRVHPLSDLVSEGDRIEIYRPLWQDPKEARRARAL